MVIIQLTTDNREPFREYDKREPWFGTAPEALLQGFSRIPEVEVHVLSCTQRPMVCPAKLHDNIWFHSLHVPKAGWLRTGYQGCIRAVRRKARELQPDIVHGQGTERDCAISAIFSRFPNVVTLHGNMRQIERVTRPRPFTYGWLAARFETITLPRTAGVVCITRYTEQAVAGVARKTWVIPNAVDPAFFDIKPRPANPATLLCVGNITVRKNQHKLIEALDGLVPAPNFTLLFLGAAPPQDSYSRRVLEMIESRPWCRYGGMVNRERLRLHLTEAHGLLLPSLEDNCPMVVLEAMAAGVPVAAARVGGVPDLIQHEETGMMFDPLDLTAMQSCVRQLMSGSASVQRMATAAKREAWRRFRPERIAQRHLEVYREVLNRS